MSTLRVLMGGDAMRVWIGGALGDEPTVVATTLERAMVDVIKTYISQSAISDGFEKQWACWFIDGEPDQLRCRMTHSNPQDFDRELVLYVSGYDIDEGKYDEPAEGLTR